MTAANHLPEFTVRQKLSMLTNQYEVLDGDRLMAYAQQKALAFREEVTFYTDTSKSQPVFSFKARQRLDLGAGYDVFDDSGRQLGYFKKQFGASLLRSTFTLEGPGFTGTGQERNQVVAVLRRFADISFLPVHFDFVDEQNQPLLTSVREMTVRDRYAVSVPDPRVDFRLAAAMAVGLDALMAR